MLSLNELLIGQILKFQAPYPNLNKKDTGPI